MSGDPDSACCYRLPVPQQSTTQKESFETKTIGLEWASRVSNLKLLKVCRTLICVTYLLFCTMFTILPKRIWKLIRACFKISSLKIKNKDWQRSWKLFCTSLFCSFEVIKTWPLILKIHHKWPRQFWKIDNSNTNIQRAINALLLISTKD